MENMTKYELIKDLPTFEKGEVFVLLGTGLHRYSDGLMAYPRAVIDKYPNILKDWFEKVDDPNGRWEPKRGDKYYFVRNYASGDNPVFSMTWDNDVVDQSVNELGNVFRTKEKAEKAVEKLKAFKRLKDKGLKFRNWDTSHHNLGIVEFFLPDVVNDVDDYRQDLDLLFGGEE